MIRYEKLKDGNYRCLEDYIVEVNLSYPKIINHPEIQYTPIFYDKNKKGLAKIKYGARTNGSDWSIDTADGVDAWFIHDLLLRLIDEGYLPESYRKEVDKEYLRAARRANMLKLRRRIHYRAIRLWSIIKSWF